MARNTVAGISGVLGELIGQRSEPAAKGTEEKNDLGEQGARSRPSRPKELIHGLPDRARLGRPANARPKSAGPKEKVTLRISASLIADYRDWSWDSRRQLGDLVDEALAAHLHSSRPKNRRSP